ncbi:MAG: hypothetical protein E7038_09270 [Lentisphaerae bacterium]|nr:hypothetical protein [Lentisphaerota bacterium]
MNEFKAGDRAVAKVGRNEINVGILAVEEKSYLVRNTAGKEFHAVRLTALPDAKGVGNTDTPAAEPEKKRSLLEAAVEVLRIAKQPMNTREIIEWAIELKLWQPTGAKTPEQTLYGAIVRENKTKEHPRIVKSDIKGKFLYAGL